MDLLVQLERLKASPSSEQDMCSGNGQRTKLTLIASTSLVGRMPPAAGSVMNKPRRASADKHQFVEHRCEQAHDRLEECAIRISHGGVSEGVRSTI
jgi:hypothetical protein